MIIGNYKVRIKSLSGLLIPAVMVTLILAYMIDARELYSGDSMLLVRWTFFAFLVTLLFVLKEELLIQPVGAEESSDIVTIGRRDTVKAIAFVALMVLYVLTMKLTGFVIATLVFPPIIMFVLGTRKPLTLILTPIVLALSIHIVFKVWLMVPLPVGPLGF